MKAFTWFQRFILILKTGGRIFLLSCCGVSKVLGFKLGAKHWPKATPFHCEVGDPFTGWIFWPFFIATWHSDALRTLGGLRDSAVGMFRLQGLRFGLGIVFIEKS